MHVFQAVSATSSVTCN